MTLKVLKSTSQLYCRMSHNSGLSSFFLIISLGLWVSGSKNLRQISILITSYHRQKLSTGDITAVVNRDYLTELVFV